MRRIYITFSGAGYDDTTRLIVENAPKMGADEVWVYDDKWLMGTEFYRHNKWLWTYPTGIQSIGPRSSRGFGWFSWKPYIILDALSQLEYGDIVLFTDSDTYPIHDFSMLYDECARIGGQMMFAAQGCRNWEWIKRDCYIVMGQDEPKYHNGQHGVGRFMLFQKGPWRPQQFLMEWLTYCVNPLATSFEPSVLGFPEIIGPADCPSRVLKQHRTEQAIMTLLILKYGLKMYREACQFGDGCEEDRDLYPTLFRQMPRSLANTLDGSRYANVPRRDQ